jgi:phenylacetate-CoA ligase
MNIVRNLILPVGELIHGSTVVKKLSFLEKSQWWSRDELINWQEENLRALIKHAYTNVPYYRKIFDRLNITPSDIRTPADLGILPVLTKEDIRNNFSDLTAVDNDCRRIMLRSTGGTRGTPLQFLMDMNAWSMGVACAWRGWEFAGYRLGDRMATIAGSSLIPNTKIPEDKKIFFFFQRNLLLSAMHVNNEILDQYAWMLDKHKPAFIRGYPSVLALLADYLQKNLRYKIRPKAILTTAETLIPAHRDRLQEVFDCKVFDGYGCGDGGGNAMECEVHRGHHFSMERAILEIVDDDNSVGDTNGGDFYLTDLQNFAMPFIRYQVGDKATWTNSPCSCGRNLPLLQGISGVKTGIMVFGNGMSLSEKASILIFKDTPFLHFQLEQTDPLSLKLKVVPGSDLERNKMEAKKITEAFKYHLGKEINVTCEFVQDIPVAASGKRRFFVSSTES